MRVGVNARLLHSPETRGWNRYTVNLLAALPPLGVDLVLYTDRPIHPSHLARLPEGSFVERVGAIRPYTAWEQFWLPAQCRRDRVDVLHAPGNFGLPWSCPCPRVLTLHDAIDHVYYAPRRSFRERWGLLSLRGRFAQWVARTRAERVITDSEHARGDLVGHLGLPAAKVRAIHLAADPVLAAPVSPEAQAETRARLDLGRPYVLYVGGWEGRKNLPLLVRGFADAGLDGVDLVLGGGREGQRAALVDLARSLGVDGRLRPLGWVDEADLPALYASALCLAYPSEYEGFGLQAVEAMTVGCPVLAARATSLPEVLGTGGETFALDDPAELAALLRRVATEPAVREDLARRGRERAADFSWRKAAEETLSVYKELTCASAVRS
ncbi:MAG: glycosyltransferase family 1 protein [Isosphaeraceae bacterium]